MISYTFDILTVEYFMLILVRISCFIFAAPFYGANEVASRIKIGIALFTSVIVYTCIPVSEVSYVSEVGFAVMVLKEGITGLLIGYGANICNSIILFAGTIIDMDIGLSMAQVFDASTNSQQSITGSLYQRFLLLMLLVTNMHQYLLRAIIESFSLIPLGGAVFNWDSLVVTMVQFVTDLFIISFRIMLPIFACIMILNTILGIIVKVAPQMNLFAIGVQLKLFVGLGVIFLTIFLFPSVCNFIFKEMKTVIVSIIEGMY